MILNEACFLRASAQWCLQVTTSLYRFLQVARLRSWLRPRTSWRVYRVVSELAPDLLDVIDKIAWEAERVPRVTRRECFDINDALGDDKSQIEK